LINRVIRVRRAHAVVDKGCAPPAGIVLVFLTQLFRVAPPDYKGCYPVAAVIIILFPNPLSYAYFCDPAQRIIDILRSGRAVGARFHGAVEVEG
jgi:hypothetical protein